VAKLEIMTISSSVDKIAVADGVKFGVTILDNYTLG
jgi:hypothetical protein